MKVKPNIKNTKAENKYRGTINNGWYALAIAMLGALCYLNTISNGFALDDLIVITANKFTQQGFSGIANIMTHDAFVGAYGEALNLSGGRYRPLSIVSFAIEHQLFNNSTHAFHFFNVLFYAISCALLFIALNKVLGYRNVFIPLVASVLFTVHPIHTEVVANIKSRDEIYMLMFCLITLLAMLRHEWWAIVVGCIMFFLALLSKESAITFLLWGPLSILLFQKPSIKKIAIQCLPLLAIAIIYLIMRNEYAGMVGDRTTTAQIDDSYLHATSVQKFATIAWVQLKYLLLLLFPYPLSWDYSFNQIPLITFSSPLAIISIVLHGILISLAIGKWKQWPILSYCIVFYFASFFLVSNIIFNVGTSMAERFAYLPSVPFCIAIAWAVSRLLKIDHTKTIILTTPVYVGGAAIIIAALCIVIPRNKAWASNFALYSADLNTVPNSARSRLFYGIECIGQFQKTGDRKWIDAAIDNCTQSTQIDSTFHFAYHNLGVAYQNLGDYKSSIPCFEKVLKLNPDNEKALYGLGTAYGKGLQQYEEAKKYLSRLVNDLHLTSPEYYEALGLCYALQNNPRAAIDIFKRGIAANPNGAKLYYNAGMTYGNMLMPDSSDYFFSRAITIDPSLRKPVRQ